MKMYWLLTDLVETLFTYLHTHTKQLVIEIFIHTDRQTPLFIQTFTRGNLRIINITYVRLLIIRNKMIWDKHLINCFMYVYTRTLRGRI